MVNSLRVVETSNEEMTALDSIMIKYEAVINSKDISGNFLTNYPVDSIATIKLKSYKANELVYESSSNLNQFGNISNKGNSLIIN